jgi:hypothetical protein
VVGEVVTPRRAGSEERLGGVEVRFVAEAAMAPFVAARADQARTESGRIRERIERTRAEVVRLAAERDRAEASWRYKTDEDLRRRLHLQYNPPQRPQDYHALQRAFLEDKRASYDRAVAAVTRAEEKEREQEALAAGTEGYRTGARFVDGLPAPALVVRSDAEGRFEAPLEPGRYAAVAEVPDPGDPRRVSRWLVWVAVGAEGVTSLRLDSANLHGTDCPACVVEVGALSP